MNATERLLRAAKLSEIEHLKHLSATCEFVGNVSRFIHTLQRERGSSNVYLASSGTRFAAQLHQRIVDCQQAESDVREQLDAWSQATHRPAVDARLLTRLASVWHALDALTTLRRDIHALRITPDDATQFFNHLISNLLSVVFEATDTAGDPEVTHMLVAIFHFMQGKELAGQERACGAFGFTTGDFDPRHRQTMVHLVEAQERCFDTFAEFATPQALTRWRHVRSAETHSETRHLRAAACGDMPMPADTADLGERWYELMTQRIDDLKAIEDHLTKELSALCKRRITVSQRDLHDIGTALESLERGRSSLAAPQLIDLPDIDAPTELAALTANAVDSHLSRSLIELVHSQSAHLQALSDELESTRKTLRERKLIERAKGLLMTHQKLSEEQAYRLMRKTSMDQSKSMVEVARTLIDLSSMLKS